jgi:hypothetical protein
MLTAIIIVYFVLFTILMTLAVKCAPLGWEDENGFHYGKREY